MEIWKSIPGFEDRYSVSNLGRVKSHYPGLRIKSNEGILSSWNGLYKSVSLYARDSRNRFTIHTLVTLAFIGKRGKSMEVNHKDGNKYNNHIENLEYVTSSQNILHSYKIGLRKLKLSVDKIVRVKTLIAKGIKQITIARMFNVSPQFICDIAKGKTLGHIKIENLTDKSGEGKK